MKNKKVYNPSDKGKRKYVSSMRNRILAGLVAVATAASPVMTTAAELGGYTVASETDGNAESLDVNTDVETAAETVTDDSGTVKITTEVGDSENTAESAESVNDVITKAEENESAGEKTETKFLFINLAKAKGGTVILNEGELDDAGKSVEKRVRLVTQTGADELGNETTKTLINVYDKDDVLIDSEDAADNANIYVCEVKTDEVVTVKVVADNGYVVSKYDLQDRLVDGTKIDVGFDKTESDDLTVGEDANESSTSDKTEFSYPVFMKDNIALTIELEEKQEETADETEKSGSADDVTDDTAKDEETVDDADTEKDTDLTVDGEVAADDSKKDMDTDLTVDGEKTDEEAKDHETADSNADGTESCDVSGDVSNDTDNANTAEDDSEVTESVAGDAAGEDVNADESGSADEENTGESVEDVNSGEAENVDTVDMTGETHFIDAAENIGDLDPASFSTARLIILSDDSNDIIDPEHIIGNYDNIYLMQYKSVEQAMNAYAYYEVNADAVEPDKIIETAEADDSDIQTAEITQEELNSLMDEINSSQGPTEPQNILSEDSNPIAMLAAEPDSTAVIGQDKVIALIDTGAQSGPNVIERVSLIDDVMNGGDHGDDMVKDIVSQNSNAKILSIRAIGNDGNGSISAVIAGIEYAINHDVDIINLSLYANKTIATNVLEAEIQKAINSGIAVVGAAGNDGADVINYIPGAISEAWIIGACDKNGNRRFISNYGDTVDYYTEAKYTSNAAAKFSGYISKYGIESVSGSEIFFTKVNNPSSAYEDEDKTIDDTTLFDPVIENYIKNNADPAYTAVHPEEMVIQSLVDAINTMVNADTVAKNETIDEVMSHADISDKVLGQVPAILPVYQLDKDSDYWVIYVDTMHDDSNASINDVEVARNDISGTTFEGWHLDKDTGLLYVPKKLFLDEDGKVLYFYFKIQVLQRLKGYDVNDGFDSATETITEKDDTLNTTYDSGSIFDYTTTVQAGKYLDVDKMSVCVNGIPVGGETYGYDEETGIIELAYSSAAIQSVRVNAEKRENAPDTEPGVKIASGHKFKDADAISTKVIEAKYKKLKAYLADKGELLGGTVKASINYPTSGNIEADGWTYKTKFPNAIRAYRWENGEQGNDVGLPIRSAYIRYVFSGKGQMTASQYLMDGKVWDMPSTNGKGDWPVPFVINVKTITSKYIQFSQLPKKTYVALECCHTAAPSSDKKFNTDLGDDWEPNAWKTGYLRFRIMKQNLDTDAGKDFIVIGVFTQMLYTQHGLGIMKLWVKQPEPTGARIKIKKVFHEDWGVELDETNYSLENAKYGIYTDSNCTTRAKIAGKTTDAIFTTDENGDTEYISLSPGTYYIKEDSASTGCKVATGVKSFTLKDGDTLDLNLDDDDSDATWATVLSEPMEFTRIYLKKTNQKGESPSDQDLTAVFKFEYWSSSTTNGDTAPTRTWYFKTIWDGSAWSLYTDAAHFINDATYTSSSLYTYDGTPVIPFGSLRITEVQAPPGAQTPADPVVKIDGTNSIYRLNISSPQRTADGWIFKEVKNEMTSTIKIKKTDKNGVWTQSLAGATFELREGNQVLDTLVINNGEYHVFNYRCIQGHTYTIRESVTPTGYKTATDISVTIKSNENYQKEYEYPIANEVKPSRVNITKTSNSGWNDKLKEAQFSLYELNAATHTETWLSTIQIENQNAKEFPMDVLADHTYVIRETVTPTGYITAAPVTFKVNSPDNYQATYSYTITNVEAPKVQITKKSNAPQDIFDLSAYTVGGAEFGVYEDQACTRKVPNGTLTTKENGVTDALKLPCSADGTYTYWVREDKAPNGHKENKTPQPITITLPTDAGTTKQMTFTNEPETTNLAAFTQKLDSKGQAVQNVVFKVRLYDGKYTTVQECEAKGVLKKTWYLQSDNKGFVNFDNQNLASGYNSDTFYKYGDKDGDGKTDIVIPIGCTVTYQEIKAPAQYTVDDTVKLWKTEESNKEINIKPVRLYNKPTPCKISINKYREDGKTPLQGVEFELTFIKESESYTALADPTWSPRLKQGETAKATTDASGNIVWDNLDQGEYQIVETKTVSGMTLLTKPINITLPITMSDQEAKAMSAATDQGKYDNYTNKWFFYEATFDVTNNVTFKMPTTGATGVWKFIFFGFGAMAVLGTGLILYDSKNKRPRKRKRK